MRQLAAILFSDMTGYTALMQQNEHLARQKRKRMKEVLEAAVDKFNGKVLQYYGDGSLSIFSSAIDSVHCAIDIQQQLQLEPKVELRIGIHAGDVITEDEVIYGDGVNLASRIESLSVPGGVFISEKVFDEIKNHEDILTRELGYFDFKNVKEPIRVFAIANSGIVVPGRDELKGKTKIPGNRLAVLPFINMSADPENEYFSDGITEELLNALTRLDGLQVTSRTSSFAFKGKHHDVRDIAIQLNVDKILEGSVRKSGSRLRITAQLINAADGYHIWSESYDRNLTDVFEVQDEISSIIANKLKENLAVAPKEAHLVKTATKNVTAYTLYLKGLYFWNKLTPADCRNAIECFEQAILLEPGYAQAYAMVAAAYSYLGSTGQMLPDKVFGIVHQYSDKALALDDSLAEGHISKASAYMFYDCKWQEAYDELQKALQLNPALIETYELLALYYLITGKKEDAVKIMEDAEKIDPLSPIVSQTLGNMYLFSERYDDAIRQADKVLEMHPKMRIVIEMKGWALGIKENWNEALKYFVEVHRLTNHPLKGLLPLGFAYSQLGMKEKALECIQKIEKRQVEEPDAVVDGDLGTIWYGLGDLDKAFYYIDRLAAKKINPLTYLEYPFFRKLKEDTRYKELRKKFDL